jgi:chaperonin GroES
MKFQPMYDSILVFETPNETAIDGVYLPETSKQDIHFGKVIALGEGYVQEDGSVRALRLQVGDLVAYGMYAGVPLMLEGVEFLIMKESEVQGKLC